jgi:hypothetical protein
MGNGLEGRLYMLGGLARDRDDIAGGGRVRTRTCILELDVQEFGGPNLLGLGPKIEPQPL